MKIPFKLLLAGGAVFSLLSPTASFAQSEDEVNLLLEEIVVTGRKREESLQDVPISITVVGEGLIKDAGILTQRDLFELTPGIHYDEPIDRNSASPSVRGVQSNEVATNRTKVTQFIDGMPVLGSQGNIQFGDIQQVEVYRGPQSAAFGRSTFGGAINYITRDPSDEFGGNVNVDVDDYGKRILGASISGPINDQLGFMLSANVEDSDAPNEFVATDGIEYGTRSSESISGKLVFNPSDELSVDLSFSHVESDDGPRVAYFVSQEARDACFDGTTIVDMGAGVYASGEYNCDWEQGAQIASQHDRAAVLAAMGETNEDILFIAGAQSVPASEVGSFDEKDRLSLQVDYALDNGSLVQVSAFVGDEYYIRNTTTGNSGLGPNGEGLSIIDNTIVNPLAPPGPPAQFPYTVSADMGAAVGVIMSDPTEIEETYFETRWVSPSEDRLRFVVGASYYDYDFLTNLYFGGYGAILQGQSALDRYQALTGVDLSAPTQVFQETATNVGAFFNVTYDVNESLTVTAEGRYQADDAGGTDTTSGASGSIKTTAFLPRLSFNYSVDDDTSFYGQIARGNNPGGVNVGFFNPGNIANLDGPGQAFVSYNSDTFKYFEEEVLTNYEIGFKGTALDNRLQYAAAIFYMDWEDQAQSVNLSWADPTVIGPPQPFTGNRTFVNEGDLEMSGIELEGSYRFSDAFDLRFTASYLDAEYADYCDTSALGTRRDTDPSRVSLAAVSGRAFDCYDVSGLEVAEQPPLSFSLSPSYNGELGATGLSWNARADIRHQSSQYLDTSNIAESPSVTTVNASFGIASDQWDVTLYVNNLTDDDTPLRFGFGTDYSITMDTLRLGPDFQSNYQITPRQERTIGLRASYRF